jgi:hypothetical protein
MRFYTCQVKNAIIFFGTFALKFIKIDTKKEKKLKFLFFSVGYVFPSYFCFRQQWCGINDMRRRNDEKNVYGSLCTGGFLGRRVM